MNNHSDENQNPWISTSGKTTENLGANALLRQVYAIMAFGLVITGMAAWYVGAKLENGEWLFLFQSPMRWVVMLAPLAFVLVMSFGYQKLSSNALNILFAVYSLLVGVSISFIFVVYTNSSIYQTFLITSGTFGAMSLLGMSTKVDLSKYGSYLYMALIGLIIASVVNIFMQSSTFDFIISAFGVLLFCGLTAYDTQKILRVGESGADINSEGMRKFAVMGALELYLDFINLFLYLLRFLGDRD